MAEGQGAKRQLPTVELAPDVKIPALGFGVGTAWFKGARGEEQIVASVTMALSEGLLHIDEAEMYQNDATTGKALKGWLGKPDAARKDLFVTGKVLSSVDGLEGWSATLEESCRNSIQKMGIEYFDLYLVHAPFHHGTGAPFKKSLLEVWKEMEALVRLGLAKAIGVSNWRVSDLEAVYDGAEIKPCINQVEHHPHLRQPGLMEYCAQKGIAVASYSGLKPLTDKELSDKRLMAEVVPRIAAARGRTPAQILQRWNFQSPPRGRKVVISTTSQSDRLSQYLEAFDGSWELTEAEMAEIDAAGDEHNHRAFWPQLDKEQ